MDGVVWDLRFTGTHSFWRHPLCQHKGHFLRNSPSPSQFWKKGSQKRPNLFQIIDCTFCFILYFCRVILLRSRSGLGPAYQFKRMTFFILFRFAHFFPQRYTKNSLLSRVLQDFFPRRLSAYCKIILTIQFRNS